MKALTCAAALLAAISFNTFSQNVTEIPLPEEFITTMDVTDEYPKVRTGYLAASINDIAKFYQHALGDPINSKGDNTYRTLYYNYQEHAVRISLYHHNYVTEVSIMIE
ncbi:MULTISPECIES: hypothetical protein [unclassified Pseudoalteromonas]|jgi:hypothetical protein|uniref:hypothetical protein n=1 Tax=unclassified Pseudoalteromonas TaxID=194690 RepID=UPI002358989A|nr:MULTISPECIES: hypothetical protein [unclassified Pseudoalteromonas]MDC9530523.1 hypothetical protein [Pseudoalteromonas sp. Angola-7]BED89783.1 hypothetical protein PspMM1_22510 [Pseudoalteromonas sp. MM1]